MLTAKERGGEVCTAPPFESAASRSDFALVGEDDGLITPSDRDQQDLVLTERQEVHVDQAVLPLRESLV